MGTQRAPVTIEDSTTGISDVIESLKLEDSGKLFDFKGVLMKY